MKATNVGLPHDGPSEFEERWRCPSHLVLALDVVRSKCEECPIPARPGRQWPETTLHPHGHRAAQGHARPDPACRWVGRERRSTSFHVAATVGILRGGGRWILCNLGGTSENLLRAPRDLTGRYLPKGCAPAGGAPEKEKFLNKLLGVLRSPELKDPPSPRADTVNLVNW